jgi:flagellar biosynthesis protein FliR
MELMITKLLGFILVLTRMSAFFLVLPFFNWKDIPVTIKVSIVLLVSIFFATIVPPVANAGQIPALQALLLIGSEAVYGFALGLIVVLIFTAVQLAGQIIERDMGFTMADILDPLSGQGDQPIGLLIETIFMLLFLSANGHQVFLLIANRSFEVFPTGTIPTIGILAEGIVKAGSVMLVAALRLAAPMMAAFLLLLIVLGIFARIMPDMDILFISMPLRIGMGLMMIGIFLPFINGFISEFADWMGKLLPI